METNNNIPANHTPTPTTPAPAPAATPVNQPPVIPESEMKIPQEQFSEPAQSSAEPAKVGLGTVLMLLLVVILIGILTAVIIWGEDILNYVMPVPENNMPMEPMTAEEPMDTTPTQPATPEEMEAELESMDFTEMDAELDAIEADIEAESQATTTAQ